MGAWPAGLALQRLSVGSTASIGHDPDPSKPGSPRGGVPPGWGAAASDRLPGMDRLDGRKALVTGVSRRVGIAFTVARRLASEGGRVVASGWTPHDAEQ